jgi:hypothetical protein
VAAGKVEESGLGVVGIGRDRQAPQERQGALARRGRAIR